MYCTPTEFLQRFDSRLTADLLSDSGIPSVTPATDPILTALLTDATGEIDSAVYVGDRYTPAQMAALSVTAAAFVRRLCADLTLIYLKRRRGKYDPEKDGALQKEVDARLKGLRDGDNLLLLSDETEAPASLVELVRPRLIGVKRSTSIRNSTRNYYPWNPDRDGYNGDCSGRYR